MAALGGFYILQWGRGDKLQELGGSATYFLPDNDIMAHSVTVNDQSDACLVSYCQAKQASLSVNFAEFLLYRKLAKRRHFARAGSLMYAAVGSPEKQKRVSH